MPVLKVPGGRLHYERSGSGEPLLWLSGFGVSSRVFEPTLSRYTERFDCITLDNRCSGRSSVSWWPTSIPAMAADAVALLDALGIPSAHVYGASMGGMIAQEMALRFPHRVRTVVLGATTPGGPDAPRPGLPALLALVEALATQIAGRDGRVADVLFSAPFLRREPHLAQRYLQLLRADPTSLIGITWQCWAGALHDTATRLHRVQTPVLVLHGDADALVPATTATVLGRLLPRACVSLLPGAGHLYLLEQPREAYARFVDWLDGLGPVPAGRRPTGAAAYLEPVTRQLALQLGAIRGMRTNTVLTARWIAAAIRVDRPVRW